MLGLVQRELQHFLADKVGKHWLHVTAEVPTHNSYVDTYAYPDEEVEKLLETSARLLKTTRQSLLQAFGEQLAPVLLTHTPKVAATWRVLDVLEHAGAPLYHHLRSSAPETHAPLSCKRISAEEILITYGSRQRMCGLVRGVVRGLARHYADRVTIEERTCMLTGAPACEISVTLA